MKLTRTLGIAMMSLAAITSSALGQGATCQTAQPLVNAASLNGTGWFSYTNDACGQDITFGVLVIAGAPSVEVLDACGGATIASDNGSGPSATVTVALAQNETVFIFIGGSFFGGAVSAAPQGEPDSDGDGVPDCLDTCPDEPNVTNVTTGDLFPTIADAIAASDQGDTLLLGACTFFERGIIIDDRDLTIIGAGRDLTVIDGELETPSILRFRGADKSTIESLTIRNGVANSPNGGGAVFASDTRHDVVFRDVHFHANRNGAELFGAVYIRGGDFRFEDCLFSENRGFAASAIGVASGVRTSVTAVNTVFADNTNADGHVWLQTIANRVDADFVNCTFGRTPGSRHILANQSDTTVNAINCVFQGNKTPIQSLSGPTTSLFRCVFRNATGDNTQGPPVFVDAANLDYRLAEGSPGIDAADADVYAAFGGGPLDAAWGARTNNDAGVADTGSGPFTFLDAGAFEFQGNSPRLMDADFNMDGNVDFFDVLSLLDLIDAFAG